VVLRNTIDGEEYALPAWVQLEDSLDTDEIGIGVNLRQAIGILAGTPVTVTTDSSERYNNSLSSEVIRARPALCRIRRAVYPDPEFNVCRIPEEVMSLIGIEEKDQVVIESANSYTKARALKLTDDMREKKANQVKNNEARYGQCGEIFEATSTSVAGNTIDIPEIYMEYEIRRKLGFGDEEKYPKSGACQPVRIYPDLSRVIFDLIDELILPVTGLILTVIALLVTEVSMINAIIAISAILTILVMTVILTIYRARKNV